MSKTLNPSELINYFHTCCKRDISKVITDHAEISYAEKILAKTGMGTAKKIVSSTVNDVAPSFPDRLTDLRTVITSRLKDIELNSSEANRIEETDARLTWDRLSDRYETAKKEFGEGKESSLNDDEKNEIKTTASLFIDAQHKDLKLFKQSFIELRREKAYFDMIADKKGFPSREDWIESQPEYKKIQNKIKQVAKVIDPTSTSVKLTSFGSVVATKNKVSPSDNKRIGIDAYVEVAGYDLSKNIMLVKSDDITGSEGIVSVKINNRVNANYDESREFQGNIIDERLQRKLPIGSKVVLASVIPINDDFFVTRFINNANKPNSFYMNGVFTATPFPINTPRGTFSINVVQKWNINAINPDNVNSFYDDLCKRGNSGMFDGSQRDLIKANPWYGFQLRLIQDDRVAYITRPSFWNHSENRSLTLDDLTKTIEHYDQRKPTQSRIEVALCENSRMAKFCKLSAASEEMMILRSHAISKKSFHQGGQMATRGAVAVQNSEKYGTTVTNAFFSGTKAHIHEQIISSSGVILPYSDKPLEASPITEKKHNVSQ